MRISKDIFLGRTPTWSTYQYILVCTIFCITYQYVLSTYQYIQVCTKYPDLVQPVTIPDVYMGIYWDILRTSWVLRCYHTVVHLEPPDIFWYTRHILLQGINPVYTRYIPGKWFPNKITILSLAFECKSAFGLYFQYTNWNCLGLGTQTSQDICCTTK